MSRLSDAHCDAVAALIDDAADVFDYTPKGGTATSASMIVGPEEAIDEQTQQGERRKHTRLATIPHTAAAAGGGAFIAAPGVGDRAVIFGVEYELDAIVSGSPNASHVRFERVGTSEQTRPGYRIRR